STPSPPPSFNYAHLPHVENEEPYWSIKQRAMEEQDPQEVEYELIHMPRNSPTGFITAFVATLIGFVLIWHIWWLAVAGFVGDFASFVVFAWRCRTEVEIPAAEVQRIDRYSRAT